jgi:large repetitive protein
LVKVSLVKVKINDVDTPRLLYRIANQRVLLGTDHDWNLNVNYTTFSITPCNRYFLYQ